MPRSPGRPTLPSPSPRLVYWGLLLMVLMAAFWPFADILGFYFTKTDTGGILHSARVLQFGDLLRILTHPVKSLARRPPPYYRPLTSLSFSLNYAVGGLDPFVYHLTSLLLHVTVAGLLFQVVYRFNRCDAVSAGLAGLLYSLHPVLVDVIPVPAHRQETMAAAFLLAGLLACRYAESGSGGWFSKGAGLLCVVLAAAAKEVGILLVPLILAYLMLWNPDRVSGWKNRLVSLLRRGRPYLAAAGLYAAWWFYVTRGRAFLGGTSSMRSSILRTSWWRTAYEQIVILPTRTIPTYLEAVLYPWMPLYREWIPSLLLTGTAAVVLLAGAGAAAPRSPSRGRRGRVRSLILYGIWFCLPALFYSITRVASFKHSYHGVLSLSALLGTAAGLGLRRAASWFFSTDAPPRRGGRLRTLSGGFVVLALLGLIGVHGGVLAAVSPLLRDYPAWKHSQALERQFNRQMVRGMRDLPEGSRVRVRGIPIWTGQVEEFPHTAPHFRGMPHRRWLRMHFPNRAFRVEKAELRPVEEACPCPLWMEKRRLGPRDFLFVTQVRRRGSPPAR